jgi:serine O-acetyltransferase
MLISIGEAKLGELIRAQLRNNFLLEDEESAQLDEILPAALARTEACFADTINPWRDEEGKLNFNPYHTVQYCIFLYYLCHETWKQKGSVPLAAKVYGLNKMLHGWDLFYEVELPAIFMVDHPVGAVVGKATFGNFLFIQQNCTIGGNNGLYPRFGENVRFCANAMVIGDCTVGNNVILSAGACVKDQDVPDNTLVFGCSPNLVLKERPPAYFYERSLFQSHKAKLKK